MATAIRDEEPGDRSAVRAVVTAAFGQPAEADLVDRLRRNGDDAIALVAVDDGAVVGQALFSPMKAPFRTLALAPVAVTPPRQRQGIGRRLIRAGLERAARDGWQAVVVLGDPEYYRRFGFDPEPARGFTSPYAGPHLMILSLAGPLPATAGRLDHAPAFAALE